nr:GNAT family N-acetyltransferase [Angustibacter aerolatus]
MPALRLVPLPPAALTALVDGDLPRAVEITGAPLTPWFTSDATTWLWRMRLAQLQDHPDDAHWIARAALADGVAVGAGGFHGGPDDRGMVEVAYEIEPPHRGRGLATALLTEPAGLGRPRAGGAGRARLDQPGQRGVAGHGAAPGLRAGGRAVGRGGRPRACSSSARLGEGVGRLPPPGVSLGRTATTHLTHQKPRRPGATSRAGAPWPAPSGAPPHSSASQVRRRSEAGSSRP